MKRPWMPLWVSEYLTDTAHLTPAESGAYMHLIIFYWVNGRLPSDENAIARITRLTPMAWKKSRDALYILFKGGSWNHPRIDAEIAQAIKISSINSANAKRRHYGRGANADTPTPTPIKKGKFEIAKNLTGFPFFPGSAEFEAWKAYTFTNDMPLWRELMKRQQEGRAFDFIEQWPPDQYLKVKA